ncbi:MAG: acyltransferase family protein [Roseburia sp.]|nr:acyltransferase family protein [Roseburia sp.]
MKSMQKSVGQEQKNVSGRIVWLDLLRVICIFFMMMLHVAASQFDMVEVSSGEWQVFNFYDGLVRFCVPEFVMISGVFFLNPKKEYTIEKLLKNNILRIVTAYFFWAFCYAASSAFLEYKNMGGAFWRDTLSNTISGWYHLWFLNMIVGIYLVVPFLRKIAADRKLLEYFILLSVVFGCVGELVCIIPGVGEILGAARDKMSLFLILGYTGYFMAGYYFYTYEIPAKCRRLIYLLGVLSTAVTIGGTVILSRQAGYGEQTFYNYLFPNICFAAWAVFLFFKEHIAKIAFSEKWGGRIGTLAELSFGMYLMHQFVNTALRLLGITTTSFAPVLAVPVLTCVVFAVSFAVIFVISKIPFVRKYLI